MDDIPRVVVVHDDVLVCDVVGFACRRQGLSPTVVHDFAALLDPIRPAAGELAAPTAAGELAAPTAAGATHGAGPFEAASGAGAAHGSGTAGAAHGSGTAGAARGAGSADPEAGADEAARDRPIDPERPDVVVCADVVDGVAVEDVLDRLITGCSRVLILSSNPAPDRLTAMLSLDVAGCMSLDSRPEDIAQGILVAARGDVALDASVLNLVVSQWRRLRAQPVSISSHRRELTTREHQIVLAMAEGLSAKAVAARLGVALKTIENHKIRIFEKLGVRSQAHAVTVAMAYGLAPGRPPAATSPTSPTGADPDSQFDPGPDPPRGPNGEPRRLAPVGASPSP